MPPSDPVYYDHFLPPQAPIRNPSDPEYAAWVDAIGQGNNLTDEYNVSLDMIVDVSDVEEAIQFLYLPETLNDAPQSMRNSFLGSQNLFVDGFNDAILERLPGDEGMFVQLLMQ